MDPQLQYASLGLWVGSSIFQLDLGPSLISRELIEPSRITKVM